jgi:hypothetical protein
MPSGPAVQGQRLLTGVKCSDLLNSEDFITLVRHRCPYKGLRYQGLNQSLLGRRTDETCQGNFELLVKTSDHFQR